eukprot:11201561-Lingulodinium_polyedra.AAC.1
MGGAVRAAGTVGPPPEVRGAASRRQRSGPGLPCSRWPKHVRPRAREFRDQNGALPVFVTPKRRREGQVGEAR